MALMALAPLYRPVQQPHAPSEPSAVQQRHDSYVRIARSSNESSLGLNHTGDPDWPGYTSQVVTKRVSVPLASVTRQLLLHMEPAWQECGV